MKLYQNVDELQLHLANQRSKKNKIGFVPTMGALHVGHLQLLKQALSENQEVVCSIYVNPTQFNNSTDLEKYPRNLESDLEMLRGIGVQTVFTPKHADMYPKKLEADHYEFNGLDIPMEGLHRPGHFAGVATVVARFFELIMPDRAYFGDKDFQQLLIVRKMTALRKFDVEVIGCTTVRNEVGLALSSRNQRLNEQQIKTATVIFTSMQDVKGQVKAGDPLKLKEKAMQQILEAGLEPEYVEIVDGKTLNPLLNFEEAKEARIFVAAYLNGVRLIDNLLLF